MYLYVHIIYIIFLYKTCLVTIKYDASQLSSTKDAARGGCLRKQSKPNHKNIIIFFYYYTVHCSVNFTRRIIMYTTQQEPRGKQWERAIFVKIKENQCPLISVARASTQFLFKTKKQKTSLHGPRFVTHIKQIFNDGVK